VQNSVTGQLETASYRISKRLRILSESVRLMCYSPLRLSAWLKGEEDEVVDRINRRMEQMTNLNMETAEELQVVQSLYYRHHHARLISCPSCSDRELRNWRSLRPSLRLCTGRPSPSKRFSPPH
jgi:hypothetical protein